MKTDRWGIDNGYEDCEGRWRPTGAQTREALQRAMRGEPPARVGVRVLGPRELRRLRGPGELRLEDGAAIPLGQSPVEVPFGYHTLYRPGGAVERIIATPRRCHLPDGMRAWGWTVQLYAARSRSSWGIGDLADLRELAAWSSGELGAEFLLSSPLSSATPLPRQQPSPYYPSSRRYRNPLYLRVEDVPGAPDLPDLARLAAEGRALNRERRIDRDRVWSLKESALSRLWERFGASAEFDRYRVDEGEPLRLFAVFCALAERFRSGWRGWPAEYRDPRSPAVAGFAAEHARRVGFFEWLQWLLDRQVRAAGRFLAAVQDLPAGVDPDGADAWVWQEFLAEDVTFGAPPDPYSAAGQDWGLPPFIPHKLRAAGYDPFIRTIRAAMRHAGGLRIDHVMGLFRLYWIPRGAPATAGAYVRYPAEDLLGIVALESRRAGAFVVGEDLGTVESGVRETLAAHGILSTRLLWFEPGPPEEYPRQALASITTHDLPTVAGLWTGSDLAEQRRLGIAADEPGTRKLRDRLQRMAGIPDHATGAQAAALAYALLARAPSAALTATLDDALAVEERPNIPSTTDQRPNWSLALPKPLEEIRADPLVSEIAAALRSHRNADTKTLSNRS